MKQTEKYQLNQWELTDRIQMEDFNDNNLKIEAALAQLQSDKASQQALMLVATEVGNIKKRLDALENS